MLALCLMLSGTYYAQNYAGIIGASLERVGGSKVATELKFASSSTPRKFRRN